MHEFSHVKNFFNLALFKNRTRKGFTKSLKLIFSAFLNCRTWATNLPLLRCVNSQLNPMTVHGIHHFQKALFNTTVKFMGSHQLCTDFRLQPSDGDK